MATSLEKVEELRRELLEPPAPDANPLDLALRQLMQFAGPYIVEMLPADPADLDGLLEWLAVKVLEHRSDDAPPPAALLELVRLLPAGE